MGLLDMVKNVLKSGDIQGGNPMMDTVMNMVANPSGGGLQGLVKTLQNSGLSDEVASWVSTRSNIPVSAEQIMKAFSGGQLGQIASKLGVSENEAAGELADVLPKVIDKLTPEGQIPEGDLLAKGLNMMKGKLFS